MDASALSAFRSAALVSAYAVYGEDVVIEGRTVRARVDRPTIAPRVDGMGGVELGARGTVRIILGSARVRRWMRVQVAGVEYVAAEVKEDVHAGEAVLRLMNPEAAEVLQ